MGRYICGARNNNGADAGEPLFTLWNPHASIALRVIAIGFERQSTDVYGLEIIRISTRGTAANTETPTAENDVSRRVAPPSGAVIDRGNFTANPTFTGPNLAKYKPGEVAGSGFMWYLDRRKPIVVPGGTGLALVTTALLATATDCTFMWEE